MIKVDEIHQRCLGVSVRSGLLGISTVCSLLGLIMGTFGSVGYFDADPIKPFTDDRIKVIPLLAIIQGLLTFIISVTGYIAVVFNDSRLLKTYYMSLVVVILLEVAVDGLAFILIGGVQAAMKDQMSEKFARYEKFKSEIDTLQSNLECCSPFGLEDWPMPNLPPSCCRVGQSNCTHAGAYSANCSDKVKTIINKIHYTVGVTSFGIIALEVVYILISNSILELSTNRKSESASKKSLESKSNFSGNSEESSK